MVLVKVFSTFLSQLMAIASQNFVSRILLLYKCFHYNRKIFYDEMVLIFHEHHRKASCKILCFCVIGQGLLRRSLYQLGGDQTNEKTKKITVYRFRA